VRLAGILFLLILVSGCTPPPSVPPPQPPQQWRLVWGDEFDARAIDRTKWSIRDGEGRDVDLGCNVADPANSYIRYGFLVLRGLRKTVRCGRETRQYTQAYLDTAGRFSWTYGRFEIRARAPSHGTGIWPAFWLRPEDGGHGEIDVVELPGGNRWQDKATAAIFYDYSPLKQDTRVALPGGGTPGDGFHTYVTEWTPTSLTWFIDGQQVWRRDRSTTKFFDEVFHKPYNLRLNLQVGGWLGAPDATTAFPAEFVVDHVRVYQRSPIVARSCPVGHPGARRGPECG
jgi:beta-glucanase (GH16 family)